MYFCVSNLCGGMWGIDTQFGAAIRLILSKVLTKDNSLPVRARYCVSFGDPISDLYSVSVTAVMYEIPGYIGPRYNDIRLYNVKTEIQHTQINAMQLYETHMTHSELT